ncbi:histidinol dehydrogenase [Chitinispirillales bacterium ANBcel5]|uniref:histidinol dehydrogenase n=1 Tax=Cellulosispirillum alkaliphilum TaxID=3039283 RepID=UPI002A519D39|nr:histidinol dehydrogenase [Chitinispirillales bacterium ANBcel5]
MAKRNEIPIVEINSDAGKRFMHLIESARKKRDKEVNGAVSAVLEAVQKRGDEALFEFTEKFDRRKLDASTVRLQQEEIAESAQSASPKLKEAIREAAKRIEQYHKEQGGKGFTITTDESTLSQVIKPLKRVGLYVPGGYTVYPSTVLMNVIPATIAGVQEVVAVTPPRDTLDPGIAYALHYLEVNEVYRIGGAQAIAALAYGTESIRAVDKIVGPGNSYVTEAKRMVYGSVDIDSVAGPSEVVVIADQSADPTFVALDLLAQAEHGSGDETAICITESKTVAENVARATLEEIGRSPAKETLEKLPAHAITIFLTSSRTETIELSDSIAPEHLQIITENAHEDLKQINNASAIFLGPHTPVAMGDYMAGTNHVLPTGGAARYASPLGVDSFQKRISVAEMTPEGLKHVAPFLSVFARSEAFVHHALSVERRVGM